MALLRGRAEGALARNGNQRTRLQTIAGSPPDLSDLPPGCAFAARCSFAEAPCRQIQPPVVQLTPQHLTRCLRSEALASAMPATSSAPTPTLSP